MKSLTKFINEELDNNIIWMLDQWFYNNDQEKLEFMDIIAKCQINNTQENIKELLDKTNKLKSHLKEFVSFLNDDVSKEITDYIYSFTNIVKQVIANKSNKNKYIPVLSTND